MTSTTRLAGHTVRRVGFGALRLLGPQGFGPPQDPDAAAAVLAEAASRVDVIDTADCYGPHVSERMIADVLYPYRAGLLIATKGGLTCPSPGVWIPDAAPARLRACCEQSLNRLRLACLDLYTLHCVDPKVPFEHSVEALAELAEEGLVRHVGLSNVSAEQLRLAETIVPIVSVQNRYSINFRGNDALVDDCAAKGIAFLPWFPLNRGTVATDPISPLSTSAQRLGTSPAQVALAWLLRRSPAMIPIPGTTSMRHLRENVAAADLDLDTAALVELDDLGARRT